MTSRYAPFSPDHEVLGAMILTYHMSVNEPNYHELYVKHGLDKLEPDKWYPFATAATPLFDDLVQNNGMFDLVSIGMAIALNAPLDPNLEKMRFADAMKAFSAGAIAMTNRGTNYGAIVCDEVSPNHLKFSIRFPSPDDLIYGAHYGFAKRYLPPDTQFTLRYDPDIKRRDEGGDLTVMHLTWQPLPNE